MPVKDIHALFSSLCFGILMGGRAAVTDVNGVSFTEVFYPFPFFANKKVHNHLSPKTK